MENTSKAHTVGISISSHDEIISSTSDLWDTHTHTQNQRIKKPGKKKTFHVYLVLYYQWHF